MLDPLVRFIDAHSKGIIPDDVYDLTFKRFTNVIDGYLSIDNISIPLGVSKKHLLLIDRYCISETQQDMFIKWIISDSLNGKLLQLKCEVISTLKNCGKLKTLINFKEKFYLAEFYNLK